MSEHVCGAPTSKTGDPCRMPVPCAGARCPHHPRTILEAEP